MQLKLYREDLKPEFVESISCRSTRFEHFKPEVQRAIAVVGKAKFIVMEGTRLESYNVIYPKGE